MIVVICIAGRSFRQSRTVKRSIHTKLPDYVVSDREGIIFSCRITVLVCFDDHYDSALWRVYSGLSVLNFPVIVVDDGKPDTCKARSASTDRCALCHAVAFQYIQSAIRKIIIEGACIGKNPCLILFNCYLQLLILPVIEVICKIGGSFNKCCSVNRASRPKFLHNVISGRKRTISGCRVAVCVSCNDCRHAALRDVDSGIVIHDFPVIVVDNRKLDTCKGCPASINRSASRRTVILV